MKPALLLERSPGWRYPAALGCLAAECLRLEAETAPKPGLVSRVDAGSHSDMDIESFRRSTTALQPYLAELVRAGAAGAAMKTLRSIGLEAERAMLVATGGVNTHRGAIFGLGLLCAAAGARHAGRAARHERLGSIVARRWGHDMAGANIGFANSHGGQAAKRYNAGGASAEAANGFPTVYRIGVPALRTGSRLASDDAEAARVQGCFALVAVLEDTNLLHRGGRAGLLFAQHGARSFLAAGGVGQPDWRDRAMAVHRAFVARRLSPGGSADLLAMSLFVQALDAGSC